MKKKNKISAEKFLKTTYSSHTPKFNSGKSSAFKEEVKPYIPGHNHENSRRFNKNLNVNIIQE